MGQMEILSAVPALDDTGKPCNFGWARFPAFMYDSGLIFSSHYSLSESDRYVIFNPTHLLIMEVFDNGFLGYMGITVASLMDKKRSTQNWIIPFPMGYFDLPKNSDEGQVKIQQKKRMINFVTMEKGVRIVKIDIPNFSHHRSLRGELVFTPPPDAQSLVTHMPWRKKKHEFRCCRRSPWYVAEGVILFGPNEMIFSANNSLAVYEWNRSVRPRKDVRFWASGCGRSNNRLVGISVGYDSADSTMGTENAFFLDGIIHKLDQVTFQTSPSNWLLPWRFTSNDGRLEMIFAPHQERSESFQMFFHYLKRHQVFGTFSGKAILDDGSEFEFQNITGLIEHRKTRY